jgi:hypothetical protein
MCRYAFNAQSVLVSIPYPKSFMLAIPDTVSDAELLRTRV